MKYFTTKGFGQSNNDSKFNNETTSFDDALVNADIGNYNIIYYTSILSPKAKKIKKPKMEWGTVLPCIMSRSDGKKGDFISCAVLIVKIKNPNGKIIGSLAIEYSNNNSYNESLNELMKIVQDMVERRNFGKINTNGTTTKGYFISIEDYIYKGETIDKNYGTVITSLCFKT